MSNENVAGCYYRGAPAWLNRQDLTVVVNVPLIKTYRGAIALL
jgi:hypothetical protein